MSDWEDINGKLWKIREAIDAADATPFGRLNAHLDSMATSVDAVIDDFRRLRESYGEKP